MPTPTKFTEALFAEIVRRIGEGETLSAICREEGMPSRDTVREWCRRDEALDKRFLAARDAGFDAIADDCLDIADDVRKDRVKLGRQHKKAMRALMKHVAVLDEQGKEAEADELMTSFDAQWAAINVEHIQRSKLRIETRLKLLSKWDPRRYGDKVQTEVSGGVTINWPLGKPKVEP